MCFVTVVFFFVFFFILVRDPFILAHAIGALLYLCIHWSVQHKKKKKSNSRWMIIRKVLSTEGLKQGSVLSPALFLLVMDPLLKQLQSTQLGLS